MHIHLPFLDDNEPYQLLVQRAQLSRAHVLVEDPEQADLILFTANFIDDPPVLLKSEAYLRYPDKCAAYLESDGFVPLIPGVYCSAEESLHTRVGRVFSFGYITQAGRFCNEHVRPRPEATKRWLFSFQGGSTSMLRKRLYRVQYNRPDALIENTSAYMHWLEERQTDHQERQMAYAETISASHFVLCPRGAGVGSIRLFEVMKAGVAPVLISDRYVLPPGVDWDKFLIRVKERDIAKLPQILEPQMSSAAERGRLAREAYLAHFAPEVEFDRIVELGAQSLQHGAPAEATFRAQQQKMLAATRRRAAFKTFLKRTALTTMRVLHIKNPYQMNER